MKFCAEKFQQGRPKRRKQGADIFPAGRGSGQGEVDVLALCYFLLPKKFVISDGRSYTLHDARPSHAAARGLLR